jgi:hypothetical protein
MSQLYPLKFSQLPELSGSAPLISGSYIITTTNESGSYHTDKVPFESMFVQIQNRMSSERWKPVPASSLSSGNDGDEAIDANYYYVFTNGVWKRISLGGIF